MVQRRIWREWNDHKAEYDYSLYIFVRKERNHSCYGCYDDWKWNRKNCTSNCDRWKRKSTGNRAWANRVAKHYKIKVEIN